ncbi:MAG: hypothetical protein N838_17430 [Thiohalocapsa sp. PB-PSB1]|nr:MAG: hypothetical protein N838_24560 [Thiohalocapsa sp. PB-PSB1]QQO54862.1 MAG: hypothetical protein N838_17430 [Thiohalocapsa sp. PB-PSB1]
MNIKYFAKNQDKRFGWMHLRGLAELPFIRRSYAWVFVIPIIAKALSQIDESFIKITLFDYQFRVPTELPFSWSILYFSGLCFLIAYIIYLWRAPGLIKDHKTIESFFAEQKSFRHLVDYAVEIEGPFEMGFWQVQLDREGDSREEHKLHEMYWRLRDKGDLRHSAARWACGLLLYLGLVMISWLIMQNTYYVATSLRIT